MLTPLTLRFIFEHEIFNRNGIIFMIKQIDSTTLKSKLENNEKIILIDVREQDEWNEAHIKQALFMPLSEFQNALEKLPNKDAEIILQCRSGARSQRAAEFLQSQGYTNLSNLSGGIIGWYQQGFEIVQE
jgi:rhodanese-related sulfurtransferase